MLNWSAKLKIKDNSEIYESDYKEILKIMNEVPDINLSETPFEWDDIKWYTNNDEGVFYLAQIGKEKVGILYGIREGVCGCLYYLVVKSQYRKMGIASELVNKFVKQVKDWNLDSIYTLSTNEYVTKFISKRGFREGRKVSFLEMRLDDKIVQESGKN